MRLVYGLLLINCLLGVKFMGAQPTTTDSLEALLPLRTDTAKVDVLNELTYQYITLDIAKAKGYGQQAIALGQTIEYPKGLAQSYNDLGMVYYFTAQLDSAALLFEKSLTIRKEIGDAIGMAACLNKLGAVYKLRGLLAEAIDYFSQTVSYYDSLDMQAELAASYNNMGTLYYDLSDYDEALVYFQRSLGIKNQLGNTVEIAGTMSNIANVQFYLGRYAESKTNYEKAITLLEAQGEKQYLPNCYIGLANIEEKEGQLTQALQYYQKALQLSDYALNANVFQASTRYRMGYVLSQLNRPQEAERYLREAAEIATQNGLQQMQIEIYTVMIEFLAQQGRANEAMPLVQKTLALKDTLFSQNRNALIAEMQTRFEVEEKERANRLLQAENDIQRLELAQSKANSRMQRLLFGGSLLVLLLAGGFAYSRYKAHQAQKMAALEKERFRAVVEAEDQARKKIAMDLHDGLGQLLSTAKLHAQGMDELALQGDTDTRSSYDHTLQLIDQACEEVRQVSHSMMPGALTKVGFAQALQELLQRVQATGALHVQQIGTPPKQLPENYAIGLYRVLQELLNNVLKHAQASQLTLQFSQPNDHSLRIDMSDNGQGLQEKDWKKSKGIGWKNIQSRISLLNGQLEWHSEPGKGTTFTIRLPYHKSTTS